MIFKFKNKREELNEIYSCWVHKYWILKPNGRNMSKYGAKNYSGTSLGTTNLKITPGEISGEEDIFKRTIKKKQNRD